MTGSFLSLGRALRLTVRPFFAAASGLVAGSVLFAAIPFGGNGLRPSDVVDAMARWPLARISLWAIWLALSLPVAARLLSGSWIRTLPIRTAHVVFWMLTLGLVAELPWVALFSFGAGPVSGLANGLLALALGLAINAGAWIYAGAAASAVLFPVGPFVGLAAGATLAGLSADRAWSAGPREPGPPLRLVFRAPPILAIALAAGAILGRGHRIVLLRVALLAGGLGALGAVLHRYQGDTPRAELTRAVGVLALPAAIAAAWIRQPLVSALGTFEPTLAAFGAPARALRAGGALVLVVALFAFGAAAGACLPEPVNAALALGGWSSAVALLVLGRGKDEETANVLVKSALFGAGAIVAVIAVGLGAIPVALVLALLGTARALR